MGLISRVSSRTYSPRYFQNPKMSRYKIQLLPEPTHFTLKIQNEENIWSNNFENNYIEQMTSRTGNYKSYQTFIKMLTNVTNTSKNNKPIKSLSYKIMTLSDLSQFRGVEKNNKRINSEQDEAKRYFLLTYQTPYEKVHYPLPLIAYEDNTKIFDKTNALNGSHFYKNKDFDLDSHGDYEKESMCSRLSELSTKDSRHNSTLRSDVLRNHRKRSNSRNQIGRRRPSLEKVTNHEKENVSETNTNSQLLQNSNYENIIQDQKKRILQLEIELKKKNSRIRELKHDNETLKSDKKLLKVKNNTLLMEISSYKNGRLSLVDHFDRNKKHIRERGRSLTRRSASRNSEVQYLNSREPSPVRSTYSIPIRYNRTSLLRSRSYERPWATNMKGTPRDSPLTRRPRTHSEDRHNKKRPATGHQNNRNTDVRAYNFDRYRSYSRPTSRTRNQHQDEL